MEFKKAIKGITILAPALHSYIPPNHSLFHYTDQLNSKKGTIKVRDGITSLFVFLGIDHIS